MMVIVLIVPVPGVAAGVAAGAVWAIAGKTPTVMAEQSRAVMATLRPIRSEVIAVTLKKTPFPKHSAQNPCGTRPAPSRAFDQAPH